MATYKVKCGCLHCHCERCGHPWNSSDGEEPQRCAKCKDPNWNKPRRIPYRPRRPREFRREQVTE